MSKPDDLLQSIIAILRDSDDVSSVWLAGSRGRGTHDEFSDIDIWIAVHDETIVPIIDDPLAFVHSIVPTVMHILAPSNAPSGGAFVSSWNPVEEEFVQVDWYFAPASSAERDAETLMVYGDVPIREPLDLPEVPADHKLTKATDNLKLALLMIGNMVKHAKRGNFWRTADHARHTDKCLSNARSFLVVGVEPNFVEAQKSLLPEPPPTTVREVRALALMLLEEIAQLSDETGTDLNAAITAMRNVVVSLD